MRAIGVLLGRTGRIMTRRPAGAASAQLSADQLKTLYFLNQPTILFHASSAASLR
jgi:hypothetical protein